MIEEFKKSTQPDLFPVEPIKKKRADTTKLSAMVVDDNLIVQNIAARMLKKMGYIVSTANEGGDAIFQFQRVAHDLLLTDLQMPVINGYQLARRIKMAFPSTKVAIMTALNLNEVAPMIKDSTIDSWLFKPFNFKDLKAMLMDMRLPCIDSFE